MSGSGKIRIPPITMAPPTEAKTYLVAAYELFKGAEELLKGSGKTAVACSFLAAQATECALKAHLLQAGFEKFKNKALRHNLETLWVEAVSCGLSVNPQPPQWCVILNSLHNKPYYFRYPPAGLNGKSLPDLTSMVFGLKELIDTIAL